MTISSSATPTGTRRATGAKLRMPLIPAWTSWSAAPWAAADGTHRITVAAENMSLSGSIVSVSSTGTISTQSKASTMVGTIETSLVNVDSALSKLSSGSAKFSIQSNFVSQLSDALTTGIGNLVDANMATESAMLTSLQTKQQLGVQALSIANQAPSIALKLI